MFMNEMAINFDTELYTCTCRHICYSGFVCYYMYFFVGHWGAGLRFIVRDSGNMTILTLYDKPNQIFWGESQLLSPHFVHVLL